MFTVEKKGSGRLQAGDVALYRRPPDSYVLHRIVEVRPGDYVILGDNCVSREYGVTDADILGVMTGFMRGGRAHSVTERGYRLYTALILHTIPLRIACKKAIITFKRAVRRIVR